MTLKNIIDQVLLEGCAENIISEYFSKKDLNNILLKTKKKLENKVNKKEFFIQYKTKDVFIERAFQMYNKILSQGYIRNNSNTNFEKNIKPMLEAFYNSL